MSTANNLQMAIVLQLRQVAESTLYRILTPNSSKTIERQTYVITNTVSDYD